MSECMSSDVAAHLNIILLMGLDTSVKFHPFPIGVTTFVTSCFQSFSEMGLALKGKNLLLTSKFFPFRLCSFQKGDKYNSDIGASYKSVFIPLIVCLYLPIFIICFISGLLTIKCML